MALSKEEVESIRQESKKIEHDIERKTVKKSSNKKIILISIISIVAVLVIAGISIGFVNADKPGPVDDFAKCLTERGAVMYGASWCKYTAGQKAMFGNSFKHVDYRDFTKDPNVKITPTWLINGAYYQNVQTFDRLSALTSCSLPQ